MNLKVLGTIVVAAIALGFGWLKYEARSERVNRLDILVTNIRENTSGATFGSITNADTVSFTLISAIVNGREENPSCTLQPYLFGTERRMNGDRAESLSLVLPEEQTLRFPASWELRPNDEIGFSSPAECGRFSSLTLVTDSGRFEFAH
ncbi:hypothetical protein DXV76_21060 [Rhodobacteraceae bacterium CCMM004]|nr:hypothetical protein DXV76_21060 [Rhodobacteraceae bacterium CCMM004]